MGWTVRGSNPRGGEIFRTCPDRPWGPPSLLYNGYRVFPGGKEGPGRDPDPSLPSTTVGHERVELYLYSPYGPYSLYRASVELYLYSPYGPYSLYRASVELYLYSPYGPYSLYRASVSVHGCTLPLPFLRLVTFPLAKPIYDTEAILGTYELLIYGDLHYITNSF